MSVENLVRQIASIDREINTVEKSIHTIIEKLNQKTKEVNSIFTKLSKEKDLKRAITIRVDLQRKQEEINRLEKDKSTKSKSLADKKSKKLELHNKLNKEEEKVRDKAKKDQKEILSIQQQITREMEKQKRQSLQTIDVLKPTQIRSIAYDVFVSHASEDKDEFVRDFVECLRENGLKVWYDELTLKIGDSLRRSIDSGLSNSRFGIVVLSEAFFQKEWPQRELDGLFAREIDGNKVILPIWHKISKNEVLRYSPMIADMVALNTSNFTTAEIAEKISKRVLQPD
ncbi:MAG: TIR domain-containing protein [Crocinitomicaceae bacterium]|nr:TIR domain-containing protein [Crocinitomicaceae bacterium]MBK8926660.1 TIR domain-containing protein [Crocinitomicaceae bacterium]